MFDFLKIGGAVKKLASELNDIRGAIEATTRKIEDIAYLPKHPEDILEDVEKMLLWRKQEYRERFMKRVFAPFAEPPKAQTDDEARKGNYYVSLIMGCDDSSLLSLIGSDRILAIFKEETAKMQPGDYGLRRAERGPQLAKLQAELAKLRAAEKKLIAGAQEAGLVIQ